MKVVCKRICVSQIHKNFRAANFDSTMTTSTVLCQLQQYDDNVVRDSRVCWLFIFKDTEPCPLQDSFSVRQQGGLPGPPPRVPHPESIDARQCASRGYFPFPSLCRHCQCCDRLTSAKTQWNKHDKYLLAYWYWRISGPDLTGINVRGGGTGGQWVRLCFQK